MTSQSKYGLEWKQWSFANFVVSILHSTLAGCLRPNSFVLFECYILNCCLVKAGEVGCVDFIDEYLYVGLYYSAVACCPS